MMNESLSLFSTVTDCTEERTQLYEILNMAPFLKSYEFSALCHPSLLNFLFLIFLNFPAVQKMKKKLTITQYFTSPKITQNKADFVLEPFKINS